MTADHITVVVQVRVKAGAEERYLDAIREHLPDNVQDEGFLRLWVHRDADDPARFLLYEEWADRASFERSVGAAWRKPYMEKVQDLWDDERSIGIWEPLSIRWDHDATKGA